MKGKIKEKLSELNSIYKNKTIKLDVEGSLYTGMPGILLFRLYYQNYLGENDPELENDLIDFLNKELETQIVSFTFASGVCGLAWFLSHLKKADFIELPESLFSDYDDVIYQLSLPHFEKNHHDFMHGGLGALVYYIDRVQYSEKAKNNAIDIIEKLEANSNSIAIGSSSIGIYWTEPEFMRDPELKADEVILLHLSHGQASKIAILARLFENGIEIAKPILEKAIHFMLANKNENQEMAILPYEIVDGKKMEYGHLGWCRGDLAISISLMIAARALNDKALETEAIAIALNTISLNTHEKTRITDSALCHGSSGLSQMYLRLYLFTQDIRFKNAADYWMEDTLKADHFEEGIAGFMKWDNMSNKWVNDYGFLTGTAGIGLSLISSISPENSDWDTILLLS